MKNVNFDIYPLGNYVAVQRLEKETTTSGGIVLTSSVETKVNRGTVIAVGEGKMLDDGTIRPCACKVGDDVLFATQSQNEFTIEKEEIVLIPEVHVMAVIGSKQ